MKSPSLLLHRAGPAQSSPVVPGARPGEDTRWEGRRSLSRQGERLAGRLRVFAPRDPRPQIASLC
jgi:hypothetical protein